MRMRDYHKNAGSVERIKVETDYEQKLLRSG